MQQKMKIGKNIMTVNGHSLSENRKQLVLVHDTHKFTKDAFMSFLTGFHVCFWNETQRTSITCLISNKALFELIKETSFFDDLSGNHALRRCHDENVNSGRNIF
jgi:hypothetical protein